MTIEGSIWTFAGMTAAVGMSVVFVALFLLSTYMHFFKVLMARLEGGGAPAATKAPAQPPSLKPVPKTAKMQDEGADLAAAVAVGLYLEGTRGAPAPEGIAAIAAALALHRGRRAPAAAAPPPPASGWKLSGRMDAMAARTRRQARPAGR